MASCHQKARRIDEISEDSHASSFFSKIRKNATKSQACNHNVMVLYKMVLIINLLRFKTVMWFSFCFRRDLRNLQKPIMILIMNIIVTSTIRIIGISV